MTDLILTAAAMLLAFLAGRSTRPPARRRVPDALPDLRVSFPERFAAGQLTFGEMRAVDAALRARTDGMFGIHNAGETYPAEKLVLALIDADVVSPSLTVEEFVARIEVPRA